MVMSDDLKQRNSVCDCCSGDVVYFDRINGDDNNNGRCSKYPKKTMSSACKESLEGGMVVALGKSSYTIPWPP